jgi:hypothetical protein
VTDTTMQFKYQIFISSPYKELREWRKALVEQILAMDHIPSGMEGFSAGNDEDLKVIKRAIDQCDIYVVIVGSTFGSVVPGTLTSFTQLEFQYARESGKPILAFLLDNDEFKKERDAIPSTDHEANFHTQIRDFREEVKGIDEKGKHRIVSYFKKADEVGGLKAPFGTALTNLIHSEGFNMPGWVRLPPGVGRNSFIRRILESISRFDTLSRRCTDAHPKLKDAMAQHWWNSYKAPIGKAGIHNLFFESGSTIAYVAERFRDYLGTTRGGLDRPHWRIQTNNILVYLEYILSEHLNIELVPHGPPEEKYGATFGPLREEVEWLPPENAIALSQQDLRAAEAVERLAGDVLPRQTKTIILATASGLEEASHPQFPGPHVGTYYNKLVKRALLQSGHPVVLFLDESKIAPFGAKGKFVVGKCHPICDPDWSWHKASHEAPVALCIGAGTKPAIDKIVEAFEAQQTWKAERPREYASGWAVIIKNRVFSETLPNAAQPWRDGESSTMPAASKAMKEHE